MRKAKIILFVALFIIVFSVIAYSASPKAVELTKINDQIWVHTSVQVLLYIPQGTNTG